jgi:hypothetical protein
MCVVSLNVQPGASANAGGAMKQMLSFITVLSLMYIMVRVMLYYKNLQHHTNEIYGADSYLKYYPTVLYSILPALATAIFEPIAQKLNYFEGHTTKVGFVILSTSCFSCVLQCY